MKRTQEYIFKEPYDAKWIELLRKNNKTPLLVEYLFIDNFLKRRTRKTENGIWSHWSKICKHNRFLNVCKECSILVERKFKKGIDVNANLNDRRRYRHNIRNFYGNQKKNRQEKRKKYLSGLTDYKDRRNFSRLNCSICFKTKVKIEDDVLLKEDEVFCTTTVCKKKKWIEWNSHCVNCLSEIEKSKYLIGGNVFIKNQTNAIRVHTNETVDEAKTRFNNLCKLDQNKCHTCGVELIQKGKSGFAQMSINKIHPDDNNSDILHLSCLACNLCQNKLPYIEFLEYLVLIADNNYFRNNTSLTENELTWLTRQSGFNVCPNNVRLAVIKKYGRHCVYTGLEVSFESHKFNTASFDRIDSSKPYTNDQTQLVCKHVNFVKKGAITEVELIKWINHLKNNRYLIYDRYRKQLILKKIESLF